MITEHDLQEAIAECEGKRRPDSSTCIKLAAFYTIREQMFGNGAKTPKDTGGYSFLSAPQEDSRPVLPDSGSEFSQAVSKLDSGRAWAVMDELMDALHVLNPRLYDAAMRKLK